MRESEKEEEGGGERGGGGGGQGEEEEGGGERREHQKREMRLCPELKSSECLGSGRAGSRVSKRTRAISLCLWALFPLVAALSGRLPAFVDRVSLSWQDHHCPGIEGLCPGLDGMPTLKPITGVRGRARASLDSLEHGV